MKITPPRKEIERYLGYRGFTADDTVAPVIDEAIEELSKNLQPKSVHKVFDIEKLTDKEISFAGIDIVSEGLARNLAGCDKLVMAAFTIGHGIDQLIRRYERTNILKAAVFQAVGAAAVEEYCDMINEQIRCYAEATGHSLKPRFSPGYGDLPLDLQKDFERILAMNKNCGISLTDSLLMIPSKSVTAFIGMYPSGKDSGSDTSCSSCEECSLKEKCGFMKN
ncbi:MAG: Vitamin B12 dependent methionine synthase activation subunit [Saccharofermentans sp.]|nr:Vitamin B12 dependent methionine synthase activation subunit [Saccharofermentans sp.]